MFYQNRVGIFISKKKIKPKACMISMASATPVV